jgi:uncharacterized membrane protein YccC
MTQAVFALAGVVLGALGTSITGVLLSGREDRRLHRESLRTTCADFTAAIARMRFLATQIYLNGADAELTSRMRELMRRRPSAVKGCGSLLPQSTRRKLPATR